MLLARLKQGLLSGSVSLRGKISLSCNELVDASPSGGVGRLRAMGSGKASGSLVRVRLKGGDGASPSKGRGDVGFLDDRMGEVVVNG